MKIGFITCKDLSRYFPSDKNPLYTHDDQIAVDALERRGHSVEPVVWGEDVTTVLARLFDILVIRSPWDLMDHPEHYPRFTAWLEALHAQGVRIENPVGLVRWNLNKRYLQHLSDEGVPIVPTRYVLRDDPVDLETLFGRFGELVVKPCISAAAKDAFRLASLEEVKSFVAGEPPHALPFDRLRSGRDFMIQPFQQGILTKGEWSLIFLNGRYSHGVHKRPKPGNWLVQDELGGTVHCIPPPPFVIDTAVEAFARLPAAYNRSRAKGDPEIRSPILYGRVDLIPSVSGPRVSEFELVEPELFFRYRQKGAFSPLKPALDKFIRGIER